MKAGAGRRHQFSAIALCLIMVLLPAASPRTAGATAQGPSAASEGHREQGVSYFRQKNLQGALGEFRSAVELDPSDAVSHDYIGVILGESGMTEASIPAFQKAIQLNEKFAEAHFHLGLAYDRTGRIADAIAQYQEALCLKPELAEARYGLSSICVRAGDLNGAIRLLRQVIEAAPNFSEARYNLALNLWNRYKKSTELRLKSDLDEAVQELLAASRLEPRQPKIHAALGRILAERQDLARAVEHLRKAAELAPDSPEYRYDLGLAFPNMRLRTARWDWSFGRKEILKARPPNSESLWRSSPKTPRAATC